MIKNTRRSEASCETEACPRPAEAGEAYCSECGLELSLYRRDSRYADEPNRTETPTEPARR